MADDAEQIAGLAEIRGGGMELAPREEARRKFTVLDAMISVAAIALSLAFTRTLLSYLWLNLLAIPHRGPAGWMGARAFLQKRTDITASIVMLTFASLEHLLFFATLAYLFMRLRKPRPPLGRLIWEPGVVASEVLVLGVLVGIVAARLVGNSFTLAMIILASTGCAILVAWKFLALRGHWDRHPSWIDRLGRAIGACWALILPLVGLFLYLSTG